MIVYLDTNCVIYLVERNPTWWPKVVARVAGLRAAKDELAVGDLTRAECLVGPFKFSAQRGCISGPNLTRAECLVGPFKSANATLEASYRAFFADPDVTVLPITAAICERAARIRSAHRFELPDALHLATAVEHGCGLFLTNDVQLARCADVNVEVLK